jgi:hypothetical protein
MIKFRKLQWLWRPLIGVIVAYAIAAQSVLIVLGGFPALAQADLAAPVFEFCHYDAATPGLLTGAPVQPGCSHCIFCFAGSHHAALGSSPDFVHLLHLVAYDAPWVPDGNPLPLSAHSIASARGPPIGA